MVSSCSFGGSGSVDRISLVLIEVRAYFLIINFDYSLLYCIVDFFWFCFGTPDDEKVYFGMWTLRICLVATLIIVFWWGT